MRNWLAILFLALPSVLYGQVAQVPLDKCVYWLGDKPAWSAADADPSGARPYSEYHMTGDAYLVWVRCSINSITDGIRDPAVIISTRAPEVIRVQVYVDGRKVGDGDSKGKVGNWEFPVSPDPARATHTIDVRVLQQMLNPGLWPLRPVGLAIGEGEYLREAIAAGEGKALITYVPSYSSYLVIFVSGLFLLGLFLFDRSQKAAFWLGIYCCTVSLVWLQLMSSFFLLGQHPSTLEGAVEFGLYLFESWALVHVNFALNHRRVPAVYWVVLAAWAFMAIGTVFTVFLPPRMALPLSIFVQVTCFKPIWCIWAFACTSPFVAFWPWSRLRGRFGVVACLCAVWGIIEGWYQLQQVVFDRQIWSNQMQNWMSLAIAALVVALFGYIFHEQRIAADDRATLRGEFTAARQVQRLLIPAKMNLAPGVTVNSAFLPAHEVGGDFYLCRALPNGTQRVLLGDVSGKGVAAALTSALLLGAADRCDHLRPAAVLMELNATLRNSSIGGFTTCLCADLSADGILLIANAGQVPPYRNGVEIEIPPGLPLGLDPAAEYSETSLQLEPGDTLTFISDGVVEARNAAGELFGFERTRKISSSPAHRIAEAAVEFGQQDDITVLTLSLVPEPPIA